jgi:CRP-like cAMP-binding protein
MESVSISILQLLDGIEFFKGFSNEELSELLDSGHWSKAVVGEQIITEGELDLYMYILVNGTVDVVLNDKILATLTAGDTFGEFGLMGERRTAHVMAHTDCLLLRFSAERLNTLTMPLQIKFLKRILFTLFARLQKVNRRIWWNLPTH